MDKRFDHKKEEGEIYKLWEKDGLFNPDKLIEKGLTEKDAEPFSMVLPPPNVTGILHMGHAFMLVIQDALARYNRMNGKKVLWIPGTDHAGIATQSKVEREIYKNTGQTRHDLGREKFLKEVEAFAKESHDTIVSQIRSMGASLDWSREVFTLDEKRNKAVNTVFKKMYEEGLIYRGNRVINWCHRCQSTLSDDEVERIEQKANVYTFKYSKEFPIAIATTRPETKLGDTGVAVHPDDERYKQYIGKVFKVNFAGNKLEIRIVGDKAVDPEYGTGAVGVTPSHSHTDWDIAERHGLNKIQIINEKGEMNEKAGEKFVGMNVKKAREKIVEWLKNNKLMENEEKAKQNLSICYRCDSIIEPLPKLQWFIDVNKEFEFQGEKIEGIKKGDKVTLKKLMHAAVNNNQIDIIPEKFRKTYFHWIDNLRDWCISRQIWYGHQIPVYYCKNKDCSETIVSIENVKNCPKCNEGVQQDSDTLDTWFSSSLWTFSTMGWPFDYDQDKPKLGSDLDLYHPTSVLETGYDILFFWVARMILMSTYLLGDIPFKTVLLHGMVRDKKGKKMSKSLGNSIDPRDMIDLYGTDATRLSLIIGTGPGSDINLSEEKIKAYRNFGTKVWNVARFLEMNKPENYKKSELQDKNWIKDNSDMKKVLKQKSEVGNHYDKYELNLAGEKAYDYLWNFFANKMIEESKENLKEGDENVKIKTYQLLESMFLEYLKMLHPLMPFVTESVYKKLNLGESYLMIEKW